MDNNNNHLLLNFVLFNVIERISRFYAIVNNPKYENMDYYAGIIDEINECLWIILAEVISVVNRKDCDDMIKVDSLLESCGKLKELHEKIGCLPIIDHQVELLRFKRLFIDGLKNVQELSNFSIGFMEKTTQVVHLETPLSETKDYFLDNSQKNGKLSQEFSYLYPPGKNQNPKSHITLPRIELKNPLAWTIIAHEISHRLIDHCFSEKDIKYLDDFKAFIIEEGTSLPSLREDVIEIHILEYWCDFLGTLIMGGSFLFSQCDAMFFDGFDRDPNDDYPPKFLRLWLIRMILTNRLNKSNDLINNESFINTMQNMKDLLERKNIIKPEEKVLAMQFLRYLIKKFIFRDEENVELAKAIDSLLNYFKRDNFEAGSDHLNVFIESLDKGYIIPSYRVSENELEENSTSIQDILLSGFVYKEKILKGKILKIFNEKIKNFIPAAKTTHTKKNINKILKQINNTINESDTCILRSIQVSEFVNFLKKKEKQEKKKSIANPDKSVNATENEEYKLFSILNDNEIKSELLERTIKIIPFINKEQIGTTSVDVRLGTSFQIYKPNHSGILDLVLPDSLIEAEKNTTQIDLDFLEGIVLPPGQFILGHTMEYLVLPNNIAAELEGRSSYARLGIEIHMTAGFVDPGFDGVLTLELFNAGPNPVKIYPGLRIGQLRFFRCNPTIKPYNKKSHSKYRGLLQPNKSLLSKDYEIKYFINEITERKKTKKKGNEVNNG